MPSSIAQAAACMEFITVKPPGIGQEIFILVFPECNSYSTPRTDAETQVLRAVIGRSADRTAGHATAPLPRAACRSP